MIQFKARPVKNEDGKYFVQIVKYASDKDAIDNVVKQPIGQAFLQAKSAKQAQVFVRKFHNAPNVVREKQYRNGGGK